MNLSEQPKFELRDTTVTYLNKLMKRVQKMNLTIIIKSELREQKFYDNSNLYSGLKNIAILFVLSYNKLEWYFE